MKSPIDGTLGSIFFNASPAIALIPPDIALVMPLIPPDIASCIPAIPPDIAPSIPPPDRKPESALFNFLKENSSCGSLVSFSFEDLCHLFALPRPE